MKKLISVLTISAFMFGATSIGGFAYQGDGICPNNAECTRENCSHNKDCVNNGNCPNYELTTKGINQKKTGNGAGQGKRVRIYQSNRMDCNR